MPFGDIDFAENTAADGHADGQVERENGFADFGAARENGQAFRKETRHSPFDWWEDFCAQVLSVNAGCLVEDDFNVLGNDGVLNA